MSDLATQSQLAHALNDEEATISALFPQAASVSVQDGYKRWAETYDKTPNPLLALEERHLASLLPKAS